jgi:hypothetical protein
MDNIIEDLNDEILIAKLIIELKALLFDELHNMPQCEIDAYLNLITSWDEEVWNLAVNTDYISLE